MLKRLIERLTSLKHTLRRTALLTAAATAAWAAAAGCGTTEQFETLAQQTLKYDLMLNLPPNVPPIPCAFVSCANLPTMLGLGVNSGITGVCDQQSQLCAADIKLAILYILDFQNDPAFTLGIAQGQADVMRDITFNYGVSSTLNIDINKIDAYVGPNGIRSILDPGVIYIGQVGTIAKMSSNDNAGSILIPDNTPAQATVVQAIRHPENPFNVFLVANMRYVSGQPVPQNGTIQVKLTPVVQLLKR
ncbi:MAG: hypothetical protein U1A78_32805 [Polyangia bacterium]